MLSQNIDLTKIKSRSSQNFRKNEPKNETKYPMCILAGLAMVSMVIGVAWADDQMIPFKKSTGVSQDCLGSLYWLRKDDKRCHGTYWLTPSNNAVSGTFTDISSIPSPYVSIAYVTRKSDLMVWCGTNSVTFPATNTDLYDLYDFYVKIPRLRQPMASRYLYNLSGNPGIKR